MSKDIFVSEDIHLHKRAGTTKYQARIRLKDGNWKRISTGTSDEADAREAARSTKSEMDFRLKNNVVPDSRTVRHVAEQAKRQMLDEIEAETGTSPTDLIFRYPDGTPINDMGRTFQVVLKSAGLLMDHHGQQRTLYGCRHTYLTYMLVYEPEVDPLFLAENAGTSVAMLERHYADANPKRKAGVFSGVKQRANGVDRLLKVGNKPGAFDF